VFDPRLPAISVPKGTKGYYAGDLGMDALAGGAAHAGKVAVRATTAYD
jgi:hypothetical protein